MSNAVWTGQGRHALTLACGQRVPAQLAEEGAPRALAGQGQRGVAVLVLAVVVAALEVAPPILQPACCRLRPAALPPALPAPAASASMPRAIASLHDAVHAPRACVQQASKPPQGVVRGLASSDAAFNELSQIEASQDALTVSRRHGEWGRTSPVSFTRPSWTRKGSEFSTAKSSFSLKRCCRCASQASSSWRCVSGAPARA